MQIAFALHQLTHSHNMNLYGLPVDPEFHERHFGAKRIEP